MSSINNVRNLEILYFSKKNKEIKKLKKKRKKVGSNPHLYILLSATSLCTEYQKNWAELLLYVEYLS